MIEPGLPVRQKQDLFYLPDLTDMEVVAMLHESIVDDVGPGMRAKVQVESMSNRQLEGHVVAVSPMAVMNWRTDVRYFEGIVKLENPPRGLRPGMTAEVDIAMPRREHVLAIPAGAVALDDGHEVCFVVHEDGLERREVKLGQVTRDMAEVTEGLTEGEQVVLNPSTNEEAEFETPLGSHESTPSQTTSKPWFLIGRDRRIAMIGSNRPVTPDRNRRQTGSCHECRLRAQPNLDSVKSSLFPLVGMLRRLPRRFARLRGRHSTRICCAVPKADVPGLASVINRSQVVMERFP